MLNLLKLEIYKLKYSKSFWLISVVVILVEFIYIVKNGTITGIKAFESSMYDVATMMIIGSIFAGLSIGTDFISRCINQEITAGHSRVKIFLSKVIILFFATEIIMLLYPITSVIINTISNGWGEPFGIYTIFYILRTFLLRIIIDLSCISLWVFFAFLFKDVARTMGVSIFIFIIGTGCLFTLSSKSELMKIIYNFTANNQARLIVNKMVTSTEVMSICISNFIIISILLSLAYLTFRRADLK